MAATSLPIPVQPWLPPLLKEHDFHQSHAFFGPGFHNHKAHALVALARLGATEERARKHATVEEENAGVVPFSRQPEITHPVEADTLKSDNIEDYLGKRVAFYHILEHFEKLYQNKYNKDINKMLQAELTPLVDGPFFGVYHGIIQIGYGYAGKCDQVVLEGLAFSYEEYSLVVSATDPKKATDTSRFGTGSDDILDILREMNGNRKSYWTDRKSTMKDGDQFLDWTDRIKLPEFFKQSDRDMKQVERLVDWALDMGTVVYVQNENSNDFFLLHGVTGAWSLLQVVHLLDFDTAVRSVRAHLTTLLMVYVWITSPTEKTGLARLTRAPEEFWTGDQVDQAAWNLVISDVMKKEYESHVFKMVQVLYEAWLKNPGSFYARYYIAGSRAAIDRDYFHGAMGTAANNIEKARF